ncbi:hypothetical protein SAMN02990966_06116 [Rhodospirillales bacterium URHD0017]|nr:hypothetical protein SAMN02990966_06116 [Rhodospirillales bacterium URHD0017]
MLRQRASVAWLHLASGTPGAPRRQGRFSARGIDLILVGRRGTRPPSKLASESDFDSCDACTSKGPQQPVALAAIIADSVSTTSYCRRAAQVIGGYGDVRRPLVDLPRHWHCGGMSDVVSPRFPVWLTYQQVAERLGLRSASAAASRARRGKWPRRIKNDTLEAEVCVPAEVLEAGPQKPRERREAAGSAADAGALGDAVSAAVAPLQAVIERLSAELAAARTANEALRDQLAASQSEAAELRGRSAANEAALEREVTDRRAVQQQADHSRREHQAAQERVAQAHVSVREQQARLQTTEDLVTRLKRELTETQRATERRRWWQWR